MPAAVLGLRNDQNAFVTADGLWDTRDIPARIRRCPFVFSSHDDGRCPTLCVDEVSPDMNRRQRSGALGVSDGQSTAYFDSVLAFTKE